MLSFFLADEQERVQKKTFTNWINMHLSEHDPPMRCTELFEDIKSGVMLLSLLEVLSGETIVSSITFLLLIAYTFREDQEFVFIIIVQFMMSANNRIRFVLKIIFVSLYITPSHYHHCPNLSEDIELIKCLSDIFCRVCE